MAHGNTMCPDTNGYDSEDDGISITTRSSFDSRAIVLNDRIQSWRHRVSSSKALEDR
eukprot:CAMPEP_0171990414 /NCGR_PEP_ID=MMETSP0993-20121228/276906_1 /TAXON_ID=483369 /ORGANISM="non described non described, Strain CCMP2098" /LENGTH=56 /DNA_ID=CAMNT_0012643423 /DNA_START=781 /DNA_END=951 /DNA_ORIENTATION=-